LALGSRVCSRTFAVLQGLNFWSSQSASLPGRSRGGVSLLGQGTRLGLSSCNDSPPGAKNSSFPKEEIQDRKKKKVPAVTPFKLQYY
jgi:hypothetical protein